MSAKTKYFSILMLGGMGFYSIHAQAITTINTDELYTESLKLERSSAEIPSSIDSDSNKINSTDEEYVLEAVDANDEAAAISEAAKPEKKKTSKASKAKKSSQY